MLILESSPSFIQAELCVLLVAENYGVIGQKSGLCVVNAEKAEMLFFCLDGDAITANLQWSKACTDGARGWPVLRGGGSRRTSQEFCTPAALNILAQMNHLSPPGEPEQISLFLRCDSCSHSQQQSHWSVMSFSARFRLWDAVGGGSTRQGCDTFMSPRRAVNWRPNGEPELLWRDGVGSRVSLLARAQRTRSPWMTLAIAPFRS